MLPVSLIGMNAELMCVNILSFIADRLLVLGLEKQFNTQILSILWK
jgi:ribonucleoside-diphosphate reductase beta chain